MAEHWGDRHNWRLDRDLERGERARSARDRNGPDNEPRIRTFDEDEWLSENEHDPRLQGNAYRRDYYDDFVGRDSRPENLRQQEPRGGAGFGHDHHSSSSAPEPGGHSGKGPQGYKRTDDRLREDVCERLTDHDDIDASQVVVEVKEGGVMLSGEVENRHEKRLAEDVAAGVKGVREVTNGIRVKSGLFQSPVQEGVLR